MFIFNYFECWAESSVSGSRQAVFPDIQTGWGWVCTWGWVVLGLGQHWHHTPLGNKPALPAQRYAPSTLLPHLQPREGARALTPEGWQPQSVFKQTTSERPQPLLLEDMRAAPGPAKCCCARRFGRSLRKGRFLVERNESPFVVTLQRFTYKCKVPLCR